MNIDYSELEEQFAAKKPHQHTTTCSALRVRETGPQPVSVLDVDRSRNIGVLMRSLKMDAAGIQKAVQATLLNERNGALEEFEVEGILAAFPSLDEENKLKRLG